MTVKIPPKTKKEMAADVGVSMRTFQRWLKQADLDIKRGLICEEIQAMIRAKIAKSKMLS
jgi:predicted DNA-binding protein (UPF0251 family)